MTESILLVEDRAELREMLQQALATSPAQYQVFPAADLSSALTLLHSRHFSAVLTDLKLPTGSGMDVLRAAQQADPTLPVVLMTAFGSIAEAVTAMREGAYDFIEKPIDLDRLQLLLRRAIERQQLQRENIVLKEEYARRFGFPRLVGEHAAMRASAREMQRIAASATTVLLLGESGTGKELFARAIHQLSPRAARPFLALNCAALPEALIENELFGHERGAFTGADSRRAGRFEMADGGTLFLDEVGELPPSAQAKLLRVLEEGVVERLGGSTPLQCDVRVISATNRDLESAARDKQFRPDLYYRLAVFTIRIPPLRERGDDVLLLAQHFLERFRRELKKPRLSLAPDALSALSKHLWPGNVRELQNVMERAAILNDSVITAADLGLAAHVTGARVPTSLGGAPPSASASPPAAPPAGTSLPELSARAVEQVERARIEATLRECKWNKAATAQRLGISYKTLLNKIHAYDLG